MNAKKALLTVALALLPYACSSEVGEMGGGSETNWLAHCDEDDDCSAGVCLCGVCTVECSSDDSCPGGSGPAHCATSASSEFRDACGSESTKAGICLTASAAQTDGGSETESVTSSTSFSDIALYNGSEGALVGKCLLNASFGSATESDCSVVDFPADGVTCDCAARGLENAEGAALDAARELYRRGEACDSTDKPDCADTCACVVPALTGSALDTCRSSPDQADLAPGFCLVSPEVGAATELLDKCPSDSMVLLRLGYPSNGDKGAMAITCTPHGSHSIPGSSAARPVGSPCVPSFEYDPTFSGFSALEVNVETGSNQCADQVCVAVNFEGRTDCPYGQPEPGRTGYPTPPKACVTPDGQPVTTVVRPQVVERPADGAVYCSCQCDGEGPGPFCDCPTGFACEPLIRSYGVGTQAASYCVKAGTQVTNPTELLAKEKCNSAGPPTCGNP